MFYSFFTLLFTTTFRYAVTLTRIKLKVKLMYLRCSLNFQFFFLVQMKAGEKNLWIWTGATLTIFYLFLNFFIVCHKMAEMNSDSYPAVLKSTKKKVCTINISDVDNILKNTMSPKQMK